jgi:hypothetical protein
MRLKRRPPSVETRSVHTRFGPGGRDPAVGLKTRFGPGGRDPVTRMKHGLRSNTRRQRLLDEARAWLLEKAQALEADRQHIVMRDSHERYLELDLLTRHLAARLMAEGVFTHRGRVRSTFGAYLQVVDRWHRTATLLNSSPPPTAPICRVVILPSNGRT